MWFGYEMRGEGRNTYQIVLAVLNRRETKIMIDSFLLLLFNYMIGKTKTFNKDHLFLIRKALL